MASRAEITTRYAKAYARASKRDKGAILDQVVEVTGWSRDKARRRLAAATMWFPPNRGGLTYATSRSGAAVFL